MSGPCLSTSVGDHPLRPPTDRSLGKPLPYQQTEEFMKIKEGDNFGWPYTYYDHFKNQRMIAPEYGGDGQKTTRGF